MAASTGNWMTFAPSNGVTFSDSRITANNVGGFVNTTNIHNILSISFVLATSGSVTFRWTGSDNNIKTSAITGITAGVEKTCTFDDYHPYIVLFANSGSSNITVKSITFTYACN